MSHFAPAQIEEARRSQVTFGALLGALSRPASVQTLPSGEPLSLIARALLDLEVSAYTPDEALKPTLQATGATLKTAAQADYLFFTDWSEATWEAIAQAKVGSARDPHQAALLMLPAAFTGASLLWRGSGISGEARAALGLSAPDIRRFCSCAVSVFRKAGTLSG